MKPNSEIIRTINPIIKSGVWKKFSHVVVLLEIHNPAPIIGIDAKSVKKFKKPITELLNRCISLQFFLSSCFGFYEEHGICKYACFVDLFYIVTCIKFLEFQYTSIFFQLLEKVSSYS